MTDRPRHYPTADLRGYLDPLYRGGYPDSDWVDPDEPEIAARLAAYEARLDDGDWIDSDPEPLPEGRRTGWLAVAVIVSVTLIAAALMLGG